MEYYQHKELRKIEKRVFTRLLKDIETAREAVDFDLPEDLQGHGYDCEESENIGVCASLSYDISDKLDELEKLAEKYLDEAKKALSDLEK